MRLRRIVLILGILMFALGFYLFRTYDKPLVILPDEPIQTVRHAPIEQTITTSKKIYTPPQTPPPKPLVQTGKTTANPAAPSFTKITPQLQPNMDVNRPPPPPDNQSTPPAPEPPKDDIP
jgi:hypothetical protein